MWPAQKENRLGYERTGLEICRGEEVEIVSKGRAECQWDMRLVKTEVGRPENMGVEFLTEVSKP